MMRRHRTLTLPSHSPTDRPSGNDLIEIYSTLRDDDDTKGGPRNVATWDRNRPFRQNAGVHVPLSEQIDLHQAKEAVRVGGTNTTGDRTLGLHNILCLVG